MNFKEEIEYVIEQLKNEGYTRRSIENELFYSDGYIDQTISKGGNRKLLAALRLLFSLKLCEKASIDGKETVSLLREMWTNRDNPAQNEQSNTESEFEQVKASLADTKQNVLLNQAIGRATLAFLASMEAERKHSNDAEFLKIVQDQNKSIEDILRTIYRSRNNAAENFH